jgi:hypothetical protein
MTCYVPFDKCKIVKYLAGECRAVLAANGERWCAQVRGPGPRLCQGHTPTKFILLANTRQKHLCQQTTMTGASDVMKGRT